MIAPYARFRLRPQLWIPLAWVAFALADAAKTVSTMRAEGMKHRWLMLFTIDALSWLPWALGSFVIIRLAGRLRGKPPLLQWCLHIAAAIVIGLTYTVWCDQLTMRFQPFAPEFTHWVSNWPRDFFDNILETGVLYACVLLGYRLMESRARIATHELEVAQLNEQLARSHLHALRSQIEPHFLFNALNAVAGLIREGRTNAAVDMVVQLSDFLRQTLSETNKQEVLLADEVDFVRRYLLIQQTRFADRLQLDIDVQEGLQDAAVPNLILQPLVENAIHHGIAKRKEGGTVRVTASAQGDALDLYVANDGPSLPSNWNEGARSIGISNVCRRLRSLYGDASSFDIRNRTGGGVEVAIRIPLHGLSSAEGRA